MRRSENGVFWFVAAAAVLAVVVAVAVAAVIGADSTTRREPTFNVFLPGRFPPELTPVGEAELINGVDSQGLLSGSWSTSAPTDEVFDAYRDTLRGSRWELLNAQSLGDVHSLSFRDRTGDFGFGVVTVSRLATNGQPSTSVGVTLGLPPPASGRVTVAPIGPLPPPVSLPDDFPLELVPFDPNVRIVQAIELDYEGLHGFGAVGLSEEGVDGVAAFYRSHFRREGIAAEEVRDDSAVVLRGAGADEPFTVAIARSLLYPPYTEITVLVGDIGWP